MSINNASLKQVADLVFPKVKNSVEEIFAKYPKRDLKEGAKVCRFAPSPTGFVHIGAVYTSLINYKLAKQSEGVFYLRIEDTDQERLVEDGVNAIIKGLDGFGISFDEGAMLDGKEKGAYGPYVQSKRIDIYHTFLKEMIADGRAYVCFCSVDDLDTMRERQTQAKLRPGYYGNFAVCRNLTADETIERLKAGDSYVIRLKSIGDYEKKIEIKDMLKGKTLFPQNDRDEILMKSSDRLPTYHFAHLIDDTLMGTTHVVRGDEWFSSLPLHIQLFQIMKWKAPKYIHLPPMLKIDGNSKRKLSKRHDSESNIEYFKEQGYPIDAVMEYLLNVANYNFEDWKKANSDKTWEDFELDLNKFSISMGALFDLVKLNSISKEMIAEMSAKQVLAAVKVWAEKYDEKLAQLLEKQADYCLKIFGIERDNAENKRRKDWAKWSDVMGEISYFFDDMFKYEMPVEQALSFEKEDVCKVIDAYVDTYDEKDEKDIWWDKVKLSADACGFASNMKEYKANPENYKGNVADVMKILRFAVVGRVNSPDLWEISKVLGRDMSLKRLKDLKLNLNI